MGKDKTADEFAGFFAFIGFLTGAVLGFEAMEGEGNGFAGILGGGLVGALLGGIIGHVVWRLLLIGAFLLITFARMQACGMITS